MPSRSSPSSCRKGGVPTCCPGAAWREARPARALVLPEGELPQGRKRRRDQHLVLLPDRADAGLRRPLATFPRFLADPRALVGVLVRPDVYELVEPTELARPARRQRRELLADGNGLAPGLEHRREVARRIGVDPHLVEVAGTEIAAAERLHEGRRDHDVGLLLADQLTPA